MFPGVVCFYQRIVYSISQSVYTRHNQGIHRRHHVAMVISHSAAARHDAIIDFFQKLVPISQQEVGINLLARDVLPSVVATRVFLRSEERRVGKECRSGWLPMREKK